MVAFNPGVLVPGLAPSDDKLLQSRIMSYSDAQRYRCGLWVSMGLRLKSTHLCFESNYMLMQRLKLMLLVGL